MPRTSARKAQPAVQPLKPTLTPVRQQTNRTQKNNKTINDEITNVFEKIKDGSTLMAPFSEKLVNLYQTSSASRRQEFQNSIKRHVYNCFLFVHALNDEGSKTRIVTENHSVDRCLQFILDLIPELLKVEGANSRNQTRDENMETSQVCEVDSIITTLLEGLKPAIESKSVAMRIMACSFVGRILSQMNDDIEVLEYLIEEVTNKLLQRAKDSNSDVRLSALGSLVRLQNYRDPDDEVVKIYSEHMALDDCIAVRQKCTELIGLNKKTLLLLIDRCCDVSPDVRRAAYKRIAAKVKLNVLKHDQICNLIERGLGDSDEGVRDIVGKSLLAAWLTHVKPRKPGDQGTIIDFLRILDPIDSKVTVRKALNCFLHQWENPADLIRAAVQWPSFLDPNNLLPMVDDPEYCLWVAFVWFNIYNYVREKDQELLTEALPTFVDFVDMMKKLTSHLEKTSKRLGEHQESGINGSDEDEEVLSNLILEEESTRSTLEYLLQGVVFFEIIDPMSRKALNSLPQFMIFTLSVDNLNYLAKYIFPVALAIKNAQPEDNETKLVLHWIEELRENNKLPEGQNEVEEVEERELTEEDIADINAIKMRLANLEEEYELHIQAKELDQAKLIQMQITETQTHLNNLELQKRARKKITNPQIRPEDGNDSEIPVEQGAGYTKESATKSMILLCELLKRERKTFRPGVEQHINNFIEPVIMQIGKQFHWASTEERAVECLVLFSCLSADIGNKYFELFARIAKNEDEEFSEKVQILGIKAITDFALIHSADFGSNDMSTIPSSSEVPNESGDASETTTETPTLQNKIADILLKLSMREDSMAAGEAVTSALQLEIHTCIMRLLNSGRFSVSLFLRVVLYVLETDLPKGISNLIKRDLFQLTILSKELIDSLPDALSKFLIFVLLQKPDVKLKDGINFFAQISNPHSLSKVYTHYRKDSKMPVEYVKLPLDMLSSAADVFIRYPDSHLTLTVAHSLQTFNTNVAIESAHNTKQEQDWIDSILVSWKNLVEKLDQALEKVKERRASKQIESLHKEHSLLLKQFEQHQKNRESLASSKTSSRPSSRTSSRGRKSKPKPPSSSDSPSDEQGDAEES